MKKHQVQTVLLLIVLGLPIITWVVIKFGTTQRYHSLPFAYSSINGGNAMREVSDFTFIDAEGKPFTRANMQGKIWVISFMARSDRKFWPISEHYLKEAYDNADMLSSIRFLTITTDPENDSLPVLRHLADSLGGAAHKWVFATASHAALRSFVTQGIRTPDYRDSIQGAPFSYPFVALVDKQGRVRGGFNVMSKAKEVPAGFYNASKDTDMRKLKEDMRALMMIEYPADFRKEPGK